LATAPLHPCSRFAAFMTFAFHAFLHFCRFAALKTKIGPELSARDRLYLTWCLAAYLAALSW